MNRLLPVTLLFLSLFSSVYGAYTKFSALSEERHEELAEHISSGDHKKETSLLKRKHLLGGWGGVREWLLERGITTTSSYVNDALGNPLGGESQGFTQTGSWGLDFRADLKKIFGWCGAEFYTSVLWRSGTSLSKKFIGNQFPVQQVYGGQTVRLNEVYFQQRLPKGDFMCQIGRLDAGNHFLQNPLYYKFVSNAFCGNPIGVFFNFPAFTAYPNPTWAAYMEVKPTPKFLVKFAVFNANNRIFKNAYHGLNFTFDNNFGVQWITEWGYLHQQQKEDRGLPGNYKVGAMYQTGTVALFDGGTVRGNYFWYLHVDQMIYRKGGPESKLGATPFAVVLLTQNDRNLFPVFFTTGLVYKGLIPKREKDDTTFGVAYGSYSSSLRKVQRESRMRGVVGPFGDKSQNYEMVIELNHWFQVTPWLSIIPDMQYIIKPRGLSDVPNALVFGAEIEIEI